MVDGLRTDDREQPTYEGICAEHSAYLAALCAAGVEVTALAPLEEFPDSVFVEDAALVFVDGAILLRPGAPSRAGESAAIAPALEGLFEVVLNQPSGIADGGDVLVAPSGVIIGLSDRTDSAGAMALVGCLARLGLGATIVETPGDVLHLKSACALLDDETILCTASVAAMFDGFRVLVTPEGEEAAANALRINDIVLAGAGFPRTIELLDCAGYEVVALETSEIGKLDAGLSCMSLRWSASG